jgi:subtilisin family serine protease
MLLVKFKALNMRELISSRLPSVICVGATNKFYGRPDFTNFGPGVTIWAPGDTINSSTINPSYPYLPDSGTSQAAPHVTGVIANFIAFENLRNDLVTVLSRLFENAQTGVLSKYMGAGSPDLLVNYGMANPNRIPQYPYAGLNKELVKNADPTASLNTFVVDGGGATATATTAAFPVQDPPSAATGINFEGPLNSLGPETEPPSSVVVTSTVEVSPSPVPAKARRYMA